MTIQTAQNEQTAQSLADALNASLDLRPISNKLQLGDSELWTSERLAALEQDYRRFLALHVMYPNQTFVPTVLLDAYWHQHILDTRKYASDCEMIFGRFLHHDPYFGLADAAEKQANADAFHATCELWRAEFGDTLQGEANPCSSSDCR